LLVLLWSDTVSGDLYEGKDLMSEYAVDSVYGGKCTDKTVPKRDK